MNERTNETNERTMSAPAHITQTLADLRARREYLDQAIQVLTTIWEGPDTAATATPQSAIDKSIRRPKVRQATSSVRRQPTHAPGSDQAEAILTIVKKAGGTMKPSEMVAALKVPPGAMRARIAPLVKSGQLVVTGTTMSRRISLPTSSAKEVP